MFKVDLFRLIMGKGKIQTCSLPNERICEFWQNLTEYSPCRFENFPYIFWLVLGISLFGAYCSIWEYAHIYWFPNCIVHMSRPRHFNVLTIGALRKARLVGAMTMCYVWIMLLYGLIRVIPRLMMPWLFVNAIILIVDFSIWFIDVLTGQLKFDMNAIYSMGRLFCSHVLIGCVRRVYDNAIKNNQMETLDLYK
ncbi:uncharacterized protein LOC117789547 [Drosophila innubila]|uniref:uncharacterized protein LOC117789547 n=1 Tax=Drosophila innubila TaxID=198719 RepID=UPI00148D0245|nr:uncharacterized protein LOC117789547 [Drosophila innubila]